MLRTNIQSIQSSGHGHKCNNVTVGTYASHMLMYFALVTLQNTQHSKKPLTHFAVGVDGSVICLAFFVLHLV